MSNVASMFGPYLELIIIVLFIGIMLKKHGWRMTQILGGMLLMGVLYGNFPTLPATVDNAVVGILRAFGVV